MRIWSKLLVIGGAAVAISYLRKLRVGPQGADATPEDSFSASGAEMADADLSAIATQSGIADVDPEPISHVAGEGIDLDRDVAAHEEIAELRARLPRV